MFLALLLGQLNGYGQIDPKKLDSLSRSIDSSAKLYRQQQDGIIKAQDSTERSEVNKAFQHSGDHDQLYAEQKAREEKDRQKGIIRIVTGVLLLLILIIVVFRKKKTAT